MLGRHVHGAWGPGVIDGDDPYTGMGLGTIILVSTHTRNLRDYLVYTSRGMWTMGPHLQEWTYRGSVQELCGDVPQVPDRVNVQSLLGVCSEFYCYNNNQGCVSMYVRTTNQQQMHTYAVYELRDVTEPMDFWRSECVRFRGCYDMTEFA